jgi:hypothetical protein
MSINNPIFGVILIIKKVLAEKNIPHSLRPAGFS